MKYGYTYVYECITINICETYREEEISIIDKCIEEAIKKIPENIKKHLEKNNFEINVVSKKYINKEIYLENDGITMLEIIKRKFKTLTKYITFSNSRNGCFIWGKCCIYVILHKDMEKIILHEIGHFLDYIGKSSLVYEDINELRKQDKKIPVLIKKGIKPFRKSGNLVFFAIYKKEKKGYSFLEEHYKNKYSEHFAESFARYLMKDSKLSKFTKTEKYVKEFIENFKPIEITKNN